MYLHIYKLTYVYTVVNTQKFQTSSKRTTNGRGSTADQILFILLFLIVKKREVMIRNAYLNAQLHCPILGSYDFHNKFQK